ncbi:MAG: sodium:solute symporter [Bacteroidota bacterium]
MHWLDWTVMIGTLTAIVAYGVIKTRRIDNVKDYLLGERDLKWWTIGLSVMATQASAITFLSTPGQGFDSGMGFAQFYIGLPVAMVILCIFVLPFYYRLNVYTAYEYLETRFDRRVRTLTAILFLVQRGLAAGITIYAPAIILSTILNWSLGLTVLIIGLVVIFYTVLGGSKAVSVTQKQQMIVILLGMVVAAIVVVMQLPGDMGLDDAFHLAGETGKLEVLDFEFDLSDRYNVWSGMLAGVFLFLSYFGTDQSQVQRYLSGKSLTESRLGLLFNGLIKVPMQLLVLFVGVMVYVFYMFASPPIHFNEANLQDLRRSEAYTDSLSAYELAYQNVIDERIATSRSLVAATRQNDEPESDRLGAEIMLLDSTAAYYRAEVDTLMLHQAEAEGRSVKVEDRDYVFIGFVMNEFPIGWGLIGLLLAVIFSAAMSSSSSELNALATTTVIDLYKRSHRSERSDRHYLNASKAFTIGWGVLALSFAAFASLFDNLIQAVNIVGSLFYGVILGIFVVAFFFMQVSSQAVLIAALIVEPLVILIYFLNYYEVITFEYLWLNPLGCVVMVMVALALDRVVAREHGTHTE